MCTAEGRRCRLIGADLAHSYIVKVSTEISIWNLSTLFALSTPTKMLSLACKRQSTFFSLAKLKGLNCNFLPYNLLCTLVTNICSHNRAIVETNENDLYMIPYEKQQRKNSALSNAFIYHASKAHANNIETKIEFEQLII